MLKNFPDLKILNIIERENYISSTGLKALLIGLNSNKKLQELYLSCYDLRTVKVMKYFVYSLKFFPDLKVLSIEKSGIAYEQILELCKGFKHGSKLEILLLYNNKIENKGVIAISKRLPNLINLKRITLKSNSIENINLLIKATKIYIQL